MTSRTLEKVSEIWVLNKRKVEIDLSGKVNTYFTLQRSQVQVQVPKTKKKKYGKIVFFFSSKTAVLLRALRQCLNLHIL